MTDFQRTNFPDIPKSYRAFLIITILSCCIRLQIPLVGYFEFKSRVIVKSILIMALPSFTNVLITIFSPIGTNSHQKLVFINHPHKWATGFGLYICLASWILDYSFTDALRDCGNVEHSPLLLTEAESKLINGHLFFSSVMAFFVRNILFGLVASPRNGFFSWKIIVTVEDQVANSKPASWDWEGST